MGGGDAGHSQIEQRSLAASKKMDSGKLTAKRKISKAEECDALRREKALEKEITKAKRQAERRELAEFSGTKEVIHSPGHPETSEDESQSSHPNWSPEGSIDQFPQPDNLSAENEWEPDLKRKRMAPRQPLLPQRLVFALGRVKARRLLSKCNY